MSVRRRPVLVYDGDCAFCTRSAHVAQRIGSDAEIIAWQFADLAALGLTERQASDAVQWVDVDGTIRSGHEAVAALLVTAGSVWTIIGRVSLFPGISWVAARIYRLVADNRYRLPGGTPACALPATPGTHSADDVPTIPVSRAPTSAPQVLVIGLDPYRVPGPWDPRPVADAIEEATTRFAELGIEVENCLFGLDGDDDIDAIVTTALRARPWECVVVGGGVRKPEEQLELFEMIVNLVRRNAPDAAIAFNASPADIVDAAARWLR